MQNQKNSAAALLRRFAGIGLMAGTLLTTGCASVGSHYAGVRIESEPPGAEVVYVDTGVVLGRTPFTYWWETSSPEKQLINVRFQKPGYRDRTSGIYINPRHSSHTKALQDPHYVKVNLDESE